MTAGYDSDGTLSTDPDDAGHWRVDYSENSSAVGSAHWRISGDSELDYASGRIDRLHLGFRPWILPVQTYFGWNHAPRNGRWFYGYSNQYCARHIHVRRGSKGLPVLFYAIGHTCKGRDGLRDSVSLQAVSGLNTEQLNLTNMTLPTDGSWEQLIWDMSDVHPRAEYRMSYLFESDGTNATSGIEVDGFLMFAIEKMRQYTILIDCAGDYKEGIEAHPVIPVGDPVESQCGITNNGYVDITLRIYSEVTNSSWPDLIRIDTPGTNDKDSLHRNQEYRGTEHYASMVQPLNTCERVC